MAIGSVGNASDPLHSGTIPGIGPVGYVYCIDKHEVTSGSSVEPSRTVRPGWPTSAISATCGNSTRCGRGFRFFFSRASNQAVEVHRPHAWLKVSSQDTSTRAALTCIVGTPSKGEQGPSTPADFACHPLQRGRELAMVDGSPGVYRIVRSDPYQVLFELSRQARYRATPKPRPAEHETNGSPLESNPSS